jgi:hypothetical protein
MWIRPRVLLGFVSLVLLSTIGADGCTSNEGGGGTGGAGGATGGQGGFAGGGRGGGAGTGGAVVYGDTCASGIPMGTNCTQGTASVGSIVFGGGFDAYEGRTVSAAFGPLTRATTIRNGSFGFDFLLATTTCNLGGGPSVGGALFIDANGDGACDLADDLVFAWVGRGGPSGTCDSTTFTPTGPRCTLAYPGDTSALAAAQAVCPAVGSCFDFCGPQNTGTGGFASICSTGGSGGSSGAGGQAGH